MQPNHNERTAKPQQNHQHNEQTTKHDPGGRRGKARHDDEELLFNKYFENLLFFIVFQNF